MLARVFHLLVCLFGCIPFSCRCEASSDAASVWTDWDVWSPCDRTCGNGVKTRYRACYPLGAHCDESNFETKKCDLKPCSLEDHNWSEWTKWSPCTKSCGVGLQTRFRSCESNTTQCLGANKQQRPCNMEPCPAAGGWTAWNEWSPCSEQCGEGVRYQDRTCEDPTPSDGGRSCSGPGTRISHCFRKPCSDGASSVAIFNGDSFIEYERTHVARKLFSAYIKFLPEENNGVLLYRHHGNSTASSHNDTIALFLEDSMLKLFAQYGQTSVRLSSDESVKLNEWHEVFIAVIGTRVVLRFNNFIPLEEHLENIDMENVDLDQLTFIGALSEAFIARTGITHPGFVGQMANIRINYEDYFFDDIDQESISEETNHPLFVHDVLTSDLDTQDLSPSFRGNDYTVFVCSKCANATSLKIELVIKPAVLSAGLILTNFGEEAGSFIVLFFRKNSLVLCIDLGIGKTCTTTEAIMAEEWLELSLEMRGSQAKLRINRDRAYVLSAEGIAYRATKTIHFAGGEMEFWTLVYLATKQSKGFVGILYSVKTNGQTHDMEKDISVKQTGRMIASKTASVAARYDEYHETPFSEIEFHCDLSHHEEQLGVQGGIALWLKEGTIIQNLSSIDIQKIPGTKHSVKLTLRSISIGKEDGMYGCLLRAGHQEFLVHVFGVSFDDANEIDFVEIEETAALVIALIVCLVLLIMMFFLLKSGLLRRFPAYNALMQRMPSWFTDGHKKDFLLRQTSSLQRLGTLPPDYIQKLLTQQEKAIQTPSVMDLSKLYDAPTNQPEKLFGSDSDSDYDQPVPRRRSDGILFPGPLITRRGPTKLEIPDHIKKNPDRYLPRQNPSVTSKSSKPFSATKYDKKWRNDETSSAEETTENFDKSTDESSGFLKQKSRSEKQSKATSGRQSASLNPSFKKQENNSAADRTLPVRKTSKDAGTDTDQSLRESVFSRYDEDVTVLSNGPPSQRTTSRRASTAQTMSYPGPVMRPVAPGQNEGYQWSNRNRAISAGNVYAPQIRYAARPMAPVRYVQPNSQARPRRSVEMEYAPVQMRPRMVNQLPQVNYQQEAQYGYEDYAGVQEPQEGQYDMNAVQDGGMYQDEAGIYYDSNQQAY